MKKKAAEAPEQSDSVSPRGAKKRDVGARPRQRLGREERERLIVEEAVRFFSEVGFEGQTRELAKRIGVTQPLLYRYFPRKEDLIERVYQEVFLRRWKPEWEVLISDTSVPLQKRLCDFYKAYSRAIFTTEWVRIFMFAGLKGVNINRRYLRIIRDKLLAPICAELRIIAGLPSLDEVPLTPEELEMGWALHGGFYYIAIRKYVYGLPVPGNLDEVIERQIGTFLAGAPTTMRTCFRRQSE